MVLSATWQKMKILTKNLLSAKRKIVYTHSEVGCREGASKYKFSLKQINVKKNKKRDQNEPYNLKKKRSEF